MGTKRLIFLLIFVPLSFALGLTVLAFILEGAEKSKLEDIMKENGKAFRDLDRGIAKEKFEGLEARAKFLADQGALIAGQYEPPIRKENLDQFRTLANQLTQDALRLQEELPNQDPIAAKKLLKALENTCISCHKAFVLKKKK